MAKDIFPAPYAQPFNMPGGQLVDAVGQYLLYQSAQQGLTTSPFYTGGANAFDAIRGHSYDARQLAAINAATASSRDVILNAAPGIAAFFGKEMTDELLGSLSTTAEQGLPMAARLAAISPDFRQLLSLGSGGVQPLNLALGVEGLTRQTFDPVRSSYGLGADATSAIAMSLGGMLRSPGDMTADPTMTRGVPLNRGLSYGFNDIETINLMSSIQRQGGAPSMSSMLDMAADPSLDAALKSGAITPRDLLLSGTDQSAMRAMLLNDGMASEEDFYNPAMAGLLALREAGIAGPDGANQFIANEQRRTDTLKRIKSDPASFNMSEAELETMRQELESGGANAELLNQVNADRYAAVAQDRLRAVKAVHGFLSAKEIQDLGEDVMSMSSEMLNQFSGGSAHQMSGEALSQNIRELRFAGDRMGLDRDQRLAIANVSSQMAEQQGFVAAAGFSYQKQFMEAMQAYSDMGVGSYAAQGFDAYGMLNMQQQTQRETAALGGIRNSRNSQITAAASILSKREGVTVTEGGAMDVFLRDALAGQFGERSEALLGQDTETIIDTLLASSSGLSREEIYEMMQNDFAVSREMDKNTGLLDANKRLAGSDAIRQGVGRTVTRQIGDIVRDAGGTAAERSELTAALGTAMVDELEGMEPEAIARLGTDEGGKMAATQEETMRKVLEAKAADGNMAAKSILSANPTPESLGQYIRNMNTRAYAAAEGELQGPLSATVAAYGAKGQDMRASARTRNEAMAVMSDFADSGEKKMSQKVFDILANAGTEGGNLLDLISVAGVDITDKTQEEIKQLEQAALTAQTVYETEMDGLPADATGAEAMNDKRRRAFDNIRMRIGDFVREPVEAEEAKIKAEAERKKAKELGESDTASDGTAAGGGGTANIANATVGSIEMSNVTITVGGTPIVTGGSATAVPRSSRTTV